MFGVNGVKWNFDTSKLHNAKNKYFKRSLILINCSNPVKAIKVMERATIVPKTKANYYDASETVQSRLYKSLKLWSMYVDLEESFGSFKVCLVFFYNSKLRINFKNI